MPTTARDRNVDLSAAVARYQEVLAADPDQWDALYLYGTALLQLSRLREAIDVFTHTARLRPTSPTSKTTWPSRIRASARSPRPSGRIARQLI